MKRFLIVIIALGIIAGLSNSAYAYPDFVTVDGYFNSRSDESDGVFDPDDNTANAFSMFFEKGIYRISVDSGAWSSMSFNDANGSFWLWSMNIYLDASHNFLLGDNTVSHSTADEALSTNAGKSVLITQPADGNIWFFIDDPDSSRDNDFGTSITAKVILVPEPVSSSLFVLGGVVLAGRRYWQKRRRV